MKFSKIIFVLLTHLFQVEASSSQLAIENSFPFRTGRFFVVYPGMTNKIPRAQITYDVALLAVPTTGLVSATKMEYSGDSNAIEYLYTLYNYTAATCTVSNTLGSFIPVARWSIFVGNYFIAAHGIGKFAVLANMPTANFITSTSGDWKIHNYWVYPTDTSITFTNPANAVYHLFICQIRVSFTNVFRYRIDSFMYPNQTIKVMFQAHINATISQVTINGIFMEPLFVNIDPTKYSYNLQRFDLVNQSMEIDIQELPFPNLFMGIVGCQCSGVLNKIMYSMEFDGQNPTNLTFDYLRNNPKDTLFLSKYLLPTNPTSTLSGLIFYFMRINCTDPSYPYLDFQTQLCYDICPFTKYPNGSMYCKKCFKCTNAANCDFCFTNACDIIQYFDVSTLPFKCTDCGDTLVNCTECFANVTGQYCTTCDVNKETVHNATTLRCDELAPVLPPDPSPPTDPVDPGPANPSPPAPVDPVDPSPPATVDPADPVDPTPPVDPSPPSPSAPPEPEEPQEQPDSSTPQQLPQPSQPSFNTTTSPQIASNISYYLAIIASTPTIQIFTTSLYFLIDFIDLLSYYNYHQRNYSQQIIVYIQQSNNFTLSRFLPDPLKQIYQKVQLTYKNAILQQDFKKTPERIQEIDGTMYFLSNTEDNWIGTIPLSTVAFGVMFGVYWFLNKYWRLEWFYKYSYLSMLIVNAFLGNIKFFSFRCFSQLFQTTSIHYSYTFNMIWCYTILFFTILYSIAGIELISAVNKKRLNLKQVQSKLFEEDWIPLFILNNALSIIIGLTHSLLYYQQLLQSLILLLCYLIKAIVFTFSMKKIQSQCNFALHFVNYYLICILQGMFVTEIVLIGEGMYTEVIEDRLGRLEAVIIIFVTFSEMVFMLYVQVREIAQALGPYCKKKGKVVKGRQIFLKFQVRKQNDLETRIENSSKEKQEINQEKSTNKKVRNTRLNKERSTHKQQQKERTKIKIKNQTSESMMSTSPIFNQYPSKSLTKLKLRFKSKKRFEDIYDHLSSKLRKLH